MKKLFLTLPLLFLLAAGCNLSPTTTQTKNQSVVQNKQQEQPTKPVTNKPTQAPKDEMVAWKTYSNTDYGFQLKYPPTLTAFYGQPWHKQKGDDGKTIVGENIDFQEAQPGAVEISISVRTKPPSIINLLTPVA